MYNVHLLLLAIRRDETSLWQCCDTLLVIYTQAGRHAFSFFFQHQDSGVEQKTSTVQEGASDILFKSPCGCFSRCVQSAHCLKRESPAYQAKLSTFTKSASSKGNELCFNAQLFPLPRGIFSINIVTSGQPVFDSSCSSLELVQVRTVLSTWALKPYASTNTWLQRYDGLASLVFPLASPL